MNELNQYFNLLRDVYSSIENESLLNLSSEDIKKIEELIAFISKNLNNKDLISENLGFGILVLYNQLFGEFSLVYRQGNSKETCENTFNLFKQEILQELQRVSNELNNK